MILPYVFKPNTKAKAAEVNENFNYVCNEITAVNSNVIDLQNSVHSQISTLSISIKEDLRAIGDPIITLSHILPEDCIWLEGAEVLRSTYSSLFDIYGTTYGEGDGENTFALPDFRDRVIWGAEIFGYIEAGLPNITGSVTSICHYSTGSENGALKISSSSGQNLTGSHNWGGSTLEFNASNSSPIYGNSTTVQPPAIKVRVYTRYQ